MSYVDIVFDGPPTHEPGRFVEVENSEGVSIRFGEWVERTDGFWALRLQGYDQNGDRYPAAALHHHEALYDNGVLTRICLRCKKDIADPVHIRSTTDGEANASG